MDTYVLKMSQEHPSRDSFQDHKVVQEPYCHLLFFLKKDRPVNRCCFLFCFPVWT